MIVGHAGADSGIFAMLGHVPTIAAAAAALVAYQRLSAPAPPLERSPRSRRRLWCWWAAIASILAMQLPPMDGWVEESFAAHMVQHIVLVAVAAPLLILARPGAIAGGALRRRNRTIPGSTALADIGRTLSSPFVCWAVVVGYVWMVHFSPVYDLAVGNEIVHAAEHLGFIVAGVMAWLPVLGPRHLSLPDPLKVLYVMVLMPALTFCGVALFMTSEPLYDSYADLPNAMQDQRVGGMLMWILPGIALLPLGLALVVRWWGREERLAEMTDGAYTRPTADERASRPAEPTARH